MNYPAAAFVDVLDLYHALKTSTQGKVDYVKYIQWLNANFDIRYAKAYCNQDAAAFQRMLQAIGFDVYTGRHTHAFELVMDALDVAKNCDTVILGSTGPYVPSLAKRLKALGKRVIIFAANIPEEYTTLGTLYRVETILFETASAKDDPTQPAAVESPDPTS